MILEKLYKLREEYLSLRTFDAENREKLSHEIVNLLTHTDKDAAEASLKQFLQKSQFTYEDYIALNHLKICIHFKKLDIPDYDFEVHSTWQFLYDYLSAWDEPISRCIPPREWADRIVNDGLLILKRLVESENFNFDEDSGYEEFMKHYIELLDELKMKGYTEIGTMGV